ncbi:acyltransferase [Gemmobacter lutimaris]|uniref:acyltransferase n=1 Tax=Gemmobacter lutimaris TaxID=2306023 RepID=UPI0011C3DD4D|nr:hypothetical protein [Gemmobacter lutimaris]
MDKIKNMGVDNLVEVGSNVEVNGSINGNGNIITIKDAPLGSSLRIIINGNNNKITIGQNSRCRNLDVRIGNHVHAYETLLSIGDDFSCEHDCKFVLYNSGNKLEIGNDCMFSNSIIVRCGESPHLIFDNITGEYLDVSEGVKVGNHVWIGEMSYITKRCWIPDESIVAACSVATRHFEDPHSVIGGNPAKVIRENVKWIRNRGSFEEGSSFQKSYLEANNKFRR